MQSQPRAKTLLCFIFPISRKRKRKLTAQREIECRPLINSKLESRAGLLLARLGLSKRDESPCRVATWEEDGDRHSRTRLPESKNQISFVKIFSCRTYNYIIDKKSTEKNKAGPRKYHPYKHRFITLSREEVGINSLDEHFNRPSFSSFFQHIQIEIGQRLINFTLICNSSLIEKENQKI